MKLPAAEASGTAAKAGLHLHLTPHVLLTLIGIAIVICIAYRISLRCHPHRVCRYCAGTGKVSGTVFWWSRSVCPRCGGNGLAPRVGTRFTGHGVH